MRNRIVLIVLATILLTACIKESSNDNKFNSIEAIDNTIAVDKEIVSISEGIADRVVELYGIKNSTAIVFNKDVLIGVSLIDEDELTEDIINAINNTVKNHSPYIENIYISLNKNIFREIDDIIIDLLRGKSYEDYIDKISKIKEKIKKEK